MTRQENNQRTSPRYRALTMTRCPQGHVYAVHGKETLPERGIVCRLCCGLKI